MNKTSAENVLNWGQTQQALGAGHHNHFSLVQHLFHILFVVKVAYNYGHWQDLLADSLDVSYDFWSLS